MPTPLTKYQIDKIANAVVYLTSGKISELTKTKLLKLLFLLEEESVKHFGTPFFGIDFKIWQFGPVAPPLFDGLTEVEHKFLNKFVEKNKFDEYEAKTVFNDDEFSDNDIHILDWAIDFARHKTAENLVSYTHSSTSLWRKGAIKHGVYEKFLAKELTNTNFNIDFTLLFENDAEGYLSDRYNSFLEKVEFSKQFNKTISV